MKAVIQKNEKRDSLCNILFFAVLWIGYTAVMGYLFYHQAIGNENWFHSDVKAYILEMQGLESGYEFPYPILFKFGALFDLFLSPEAAITAALVILNSLTPIALKIYLDRFLTREKDNLFIRMGSSLLVFSLLVVSMLFPLEGGSFEGMQGRYKGVFSPNPHHNATYLAARPFAVVCFFQFAAKSILVESPFSAGVSSVISVSRLLRSRMILISLSISTSVAGSTTLAASIPL